MPRPVSVFCQAGACGLLLLFSGCSRSGPAPEHAAGEALPLTSYAPPAGELLPGKQVPLLEQLNAEYTQLVQAVLPGVVSIRCREPGPGPFGNEDFPFQFHFGPDLEPHPDVQNRNKSLGSGIIFSPDGMIVTNYHVVTSTQDIRVGLHDGRTFPARWVAADEAADIALLKIDAEQLTALPWGDSDRLQVGEQVFAIGNPFDLNDSVSNGIVSAKNRNLPNSLNYQDYIQTNAAINPGNSGGALVNIHGQVVGLNSAIASTSRVNMGISFAIPSNLARFAIESLLKNGRVVRGYLGVSYQDLPVPEAVRTQLHLADRPGVLINEVKALSPAEQAGLKPLDYITGINNAPVTEPADLRLTISLLPIQQQTKIEFIRDGQLHTAQALIVAQPEELAAAAPPPAPLHPVDNTVRSGNVLAGLHVAELTEQTRRQFDLADETKDGLVVVEVEGDSAAAQKDLEPGDLLLSACENGGEKKRLRALTDYTALTQRLKPTDSLLLLTQRGRAVSEIELSQPK